MSLRTKSRRGSALLIVLGMMSFMLFSGLAFSVYMRYARMPTSFLRRTTTSRQLAKAALAEAIEEIDTAIGNNPHPGVCLAANRRTGSSYVGNIFYHRVFFGYAEENMTCDAAAAAGLTIGDYASTQGGGQYNFAKSTYGITPDRAVSVLTLEGLAYLPPDMINDVRYYSRHTMTAQWRPFWFDSGRYAYVAVDVSDYFDVNKLFANKSRAASASRRISLAHLFESGGDKHSGAGSGAKKWDDNLMSKCRTVNDASGEIQYTAQGPFISLADFNIAWKDKLSIGGQEIESPFRRFVEKGAPYPEMTATDPKAAPYKQLTFVTDSWTPSDAVGKTPDGKKETVDLAGEQPFRLSDLKQEKPSLERTVMKYQSTLLKTNDKRANLYDHICLLGYGQLWDYLDPDSKPVSLAIPTTERVPMIVGVQPTLPEIVISKDTVQDKLVQDRSTPTQRWYRREQTYTLSLKTKNVAARVVATYPFRLHGIEPDEDSYQVDGRLAIFFTAGGENMSLRPGEANEALHLKKDDIAKGGFLNDSVMAIPLTRQNVSVKDMTKNDAEPIKAVSLTGNVGDLSSGVKMLTIRYEWIKEVKGEGGWTVVKKNPDANDIQDDGNSCAFRPLAANGSPSAAFASSAKIKATMLAGTTLKVNAAVWARVSQGDDTVDLVPACLSDDDELNGVQSGGSMASQLGKAYPLLRYDVKANGQDTLDLSVAKLETSPSFVLSIDNPKTFVSDPRYNHMPENWYAVAGDGAMTEQEWLAEAQKMVGHDGRDDDIFLYTSDQGYMQSVYELAYLPRFGGLTKGTKGDPRFGDYITSQNAAAKNRTSLATDHTQTLDYNKMWRTYRPYGDNRDDFENIGLVYGATGQHVNPYSDSTNVLMAAFANTPHDWRLSSTNEYSEAKNIKDAATFNAKHAWNAYSSEDTGVLCWEHLANVAGRFMNSMSGSQNWQDAFAKLNWSSNHRELLSGEKLDSVDGSLYGVDKKFLYGFWHDSFATGQQLFLIFVRAEPMMMGGGVEGQTPPQLGARAVALVWRDPNAFDDAKGSRSDANTPNIHRTRVLFYHPFD